MKKSIIFGALATAGLIASPAANAALASDALLEFTTGVGSCEAGGTYPDCTYGASTVATGSYFAMDVAGGGNGSLDNNERVPISMSNGLAIGSANAIGSVDNTWSFGGNPGVHYTKNALSIVSDDGNGNVVLDMAGLTVFWGDPQADIDMGADNATITCAVDCSVGDTYSLDYSTVVPSGGFTGVLYGLHLEGTVSAVPVPAAVWLFGSGLLGLVGVARRRKAA